MKIFTILFVQVWNCALVSSLQVLPKVILPAPVLRVLPGYTLPCSATGFPPIYRALIRNSTVLVNTTFFWNAKVVVKEEANYTCVATNKYGTDVGEVSVIFTDCELKCSYEAYIWLENTLSCQNVTSPKDIVKCASTITKNIKVFSSNLSHLPVGMFSNLPDLQKLDLSSNAVKFISDGVFNNLANLYQIDLSSNAINVLPDRVFASLSNLQNLDLSSNAITFLGEKVFGNLTNLRTLDLSSNDITLLPDRMFASLINLQNLDLSSNTITFLPDRAFANLRNLHKLYLSSNAINFLSDGAFANLVKLDYIDLSSNAITILHDRVFANLVNLRELDLSSNAVQFLSDVAFANLPNLDHLDLSSNAIALLRDSVLSNLTNLRILILSSNAITELPERVFAKLKNLWNLFLFSNAISFLPDRVFANVTNLRVLHLSSNAITFLPSGVFASLKRLVLLYLSSNPIKFLPNGVFGDLTNVMSLRLSSSAITFVPESQFARINLWTLDLSSNAITFLPDRVFAHLTNLRQLYLSSNAITFVTDEVFAHLKLLIVLDLSLNAITSIPDNLFANLTVLWILDSSRIQVLKWSYRAQRRLSDLSHNKIQCLPKEMFCCSQQFEFLFLQGNVITSISSETFARATNLIYLFLGGNQLESIPYRAFFNVNPSYNVDWEHILMFSNNPIKTIEPEAFRWGIHHFGMHIYLLRTKLKTLSLDAFVGHSVQDSQMVMRNRTIAKVTYVTLSRATNVTIYLNPINSASEAIHVRDPESSTGKPLVSALMASGFRRIPSNNDRLALLLPCPVGTFSNLSAKGDDGCTECPPGGFYSDDVGYVAKSCKECPNGSFVSLEQAPGTQKQDCKACPEGTETDFFAGYRACKCLEGFYRTHMFEKCHKCGQGGLQCQDDYATLKAGHWWEWRNLTRTDRYRDFIANLLTPSPVLDASSVQYPFPIPTPYKCLREESCKGGLDSPCDNGYEGPLCAVCSSGYYKQLQACAPCPSKKWIVLQLLIIVVIVLMITAFVVRTSKTKNTKDRRRPLVDMFLSKVKIVIGFYQVTHGLLQTFSYIKWPGSLEVIAKYSEILQVDVLQIAPTHCLFSQFRADAFESLFLMMIINASIIGFSVLFYGGRKAIILRSRSLQDDDKSKKLSDIKELLSRNLFFFLYVTYLSTCVKTANVLPIACQKLCRDDKEELCLKYMKADYSIKCQGTNYNHWLIVAYVSTAYIVALPVSSFIALWRQRRALFTTADAEIFEDPGTGREMISGLRFLFENYKHHSWYWELVETSRKVILTSGLILVGQESRSYIGLAWVIAGMYGMLFSWIKPIRDVTENRLMATSLAVTVVNLGIGAVSRIPAENMSAAVDPYTDAVLFKILVFGANFSVIGLLVAQYAVFLYRYFKEWRKNPHWSFSCCLALLVPLNDLQGEIHSIAGTNVITNQLQTGQIDKPDILSEVKNSGVIDVTLDEDEEGDDDTTEIRDENCREFQHSDTRSHQGTQTELCSIPMADSAFHEQITHL